MSNEFLSQLKILSYIGSGFFGEVHEGWHPVHQKVAIKKLKQLPWESAAQWKRRKRDLLAEAQNLKQAEHRHVVHVLNVVKDEVGNDLLLVTEFCEGGSLQERYETGPMPIHDLRRVLSEVATGLCVVHERGLLHRDIKPGNILIDREGRAKIADFGLATGNVFEGYASKKGYSDHLAYETHRDGVTSVQTDIWAFGMTMYRLLHGAYYYQGLGRKPREEVGDGGYAKKLKFLPHIPDSWRRFVRKALHDNTAKRYSSFEEVADALGKLPIEPSWQCNCGSDEITWKRRKGRREIEVVWTKHSARKHEWSAVSYPLGDGRRYTLDTSDGMIGKTKTRRALRAFFKKQS